MHRPFGCSSRHWRSIGNPWKRRPGWRMCSRFTLSANEPIGPLPTSHARKSWSSKHSLHHPAVHKLIKILRAEGRCKEAIPEYETVISSDPNFASAYANLGWCKFLTGSIEDAIPLEEKALRLTPRGPFVGTLYLRIGTAHLLQSHYEDAIRWLEKARNATPWPAEVRSHLASAHALTGERDHAAAQLAEARRMSPDDRYSSIARPRAAEHFGAPKIRALREATYFAGLRVAGMPEE